ALCLDGLWCARLDPRAARRRPDRLRHRRRGRRVPVVLRGGAGCRMTDGPQLIELVDGVPASHPPDGTAGSTNAAAGPPGGASPRVDTCATRRRTRAFLDAVATATGGAPITRAVNTHLHGDHVYGNALLPDDTVIIAQEATRQGILADFILTNTPPLWSPPPNWEIDAVRAPTETFTDPLHLPA